MYDECIEYPDFNGLKLTELMYKLGFNVLSIYFEKFLPEYTGKEPCEEIKMTYVGLPGSGLEESEETVSIMPYRMDTDMSPLNGFFQEKVELYDVFVSVVLIQGRIPKIRWERVLAGNICIEAKGIKTPFANYSKRLPNYTYRLAQEFFID